MLSVAGSVALKRGKLLNKEFRAFRYSSLTVPLAHKSFSIAAVKYKKKLAWENHLKNNKPPILFENKLTKGKIDKFQCTDGLGIRYLVCWFFLRTLPLIKKNKVYTHRHA